MSQKHYTLYVSDLDGTLLDSRSQVSPVTAKMLNRAISGGALFTVATARTPATVGPLLSSIDISIPTVVMTGAALWHPGTGVYSHVKYFSESMARSIVETYCRLRFPSFVYMLGDDSLLHVYRLGALIEQEKSFMAERAHSPYKRLHFSIDAGSDYDICRLPKLDRVILFYSMQPEERAARAYAEIQRLHPECTSLQYVDANGPVSESIMEVFAPGVSKASAIQTLRESIGADRTITFGDNVNDISMLRDADLSVAPSTAIPAVKEIADVVIGSNDEDSVARYILNNTLPG